MKIENYTFPQSSFLAVEKDMEILVDCCLKNERLKKLLYYDVKDALQRPNVSQEVSLNMLGRQIKIVPKLKVDQPDFCYLIISFDNFIPNASNPSFRDNTISFDIVCHFDQWQLEDFQLRPYKIAAEIDAMLKSKRLTGIGKTEFLGANQIVLSDEFAGLSLMYQAYHGVEGEDSKSPINPKEQEDLNLNFDQIFNLTDGL